VGQYIQKTGKGTFRFKIGYSSSQYLVRPYDAPKQEKPKYASSSLSEACKTLITSSGINEKHTLYNFYLKSK